MNLLVIRETYTVVLHIKYAVAAVVVVAAAALLTPPVCRELPWLFVYVFAKHTIVGLLFQARCFHPLQHAFHSRSDLLVNR